MFCLEFYWLFLFISLILVAGNKKEYNGILNYLLFLFYNILFITITKFNYIDLDVQLLIQMLSDVCIFGICIYLVRELKIILKFFTVWFLFFITNFQILFINSITIQEVLFQIDNYNLDYLCLFIVALIIKTKRI